MTLIVIKIKSSMCTKFAYDEKSTSAMRALNLNVAYV